MFPGVVRGGQLDVVLALLGTRAEGPVDGDTVQRRLATSGHTLRPGALPPSERPREAGDPPSVGSARMTALRRIAFPLRLAWLRLARRGERVLLVAFGIAAGSALLAAVLAGSLVAQDRSVERATARVRAEDRTVRLVWGGIASGPGTDIAELDQTSRRALAPLVRAPTRAMLFRTSQSNGHLFDLGAIDGLGRYVRVRAGRLPRPCHAGRCEVLQLGGAGRSIRRCRSGT